MVIRTKITADRKLGLGILLLLSCLLISLAGCSTNTPYAPVSDRTKPPKVTWGYHLVRPGETLYSIAWRYGRDFKELAGANRIRSPYIIYPGQKLSLYLPSKRPATTSKTVKKAPTTTQSTTKSRSSSQRAVTQTQQVAPRGPVKWRWPASGKVIQNYQAQGNVNKGIDISGKLGEPVKSAASGKVVYAGGGLLGYGKLVIVKHSSTYLSAYAHNNKIHVREGDSVVVGQKIAEIGSSGTNREKLHFEIRRNGKPVNPLRYLPKR